MSERDAAHTFETCEIVFWRGYVKCAFYAVPQVGEPIGSPSFRSRERSPMQSGAALEAHQALVEQLKREGWEPWARGRTWYALTFRRRDWPPINEPEGPSTVVATIEPPPPEPEPEPAPEPLPAAAAHRSRRARHGRPRSRRRRSS
jgi:hypothetical protein